MTKKTFTVLILLVIASLFVLTNAMASGPSGASSVNATSSSSAEASAPDNVEAYAGNITELIITGSSTTQSWQGYAGNVTGTIQLADSSDNVMYNWSQVDPTGQIYASVNETVAWSDLQCFNFTADGTYSDDSTNAGATSLYGMNLTQLHTAYGIVSEDSDGVGNTFAANNHELFYTNSLQFSVGECKNVKLFNDTGVGSFDEVLMYEPTTQSVVFASILKSDANGFDNGTHDFEMLVLENGHSGDVEATPYYFYMEIA